MILWQHCKGLIKKKRDDEGGGVKNVLTFSNSDCRYLSCVFLVCTFSSTKFLRFIYCQTLSFSQQGYNNVTLDIVKLFENVWNYQQLNGQTLVNLRVGQGQMKIILLCGLVCLNNYNYFPFDLKRLLFILFWLFSQFQRKLTV